MIPPWLQRSLEAAGRWNADGVSRRLSAARCRDCGAPVLRGLDADICALAVTCDPQPIDAVGEVLALAAGRQTVNVSHAGGRWELDRRDRWRIAGRRPGEVLAEHRCHAPPLPAGPPLTDPTPTPRPGSECPF